MSKIEKDIAKAIKVHKIEKKLMMAFYSNFYSYQPKYYPKLN